MILVAGGTGTLGVPLVRALVARTDRVRVLTRNPRHADTLRASGIDAVTGDVRDPATLTRACAGCTGVVSAIHGFTGGRGCNPATIDRDGNIALIGACRDAGAEHLTLISVSGAAPSHPMSLHRMKFAAEQALAASGLLWTVVRPMPFLETWIDLIGAEIPTRGRALVFGPGENPINFVSARDVADVTARAVGDEHMFRQILEVTGPEDLTFNQIATRLTVAAGLPANTRHVPLAAMRAMSRLTRRVAPAVARQTQAAVVMNTTDMTAHHDRGHVGCTTVDQLIQERSNLLAQQVTMRRHTGAERSRR